jgi:cystathionine beta-synthase
MARRLVREEGIFGGGSCGSAVAGAVKFAQQHRLDGDDVMVIVLPDSGTRYLSKVYDDDWLRENGFLERLWVDIRASDIQSAKPASQVHTARSTDRVSDVIARLKEYNVSQLPVVDANGRLRGIVAEVDLLNHMLLTDHGHHAPDENIESMIDPNVPVVSPNTNLETLMAFFSNRTAVVIATEGQIQGILTKIDILDYLTNQAR